MPSSAQLVALEVKVDGALMHSNGRMGPVEMRTPNPAVPSRPATSSSKRASAGQRRVSSLKGCTKNDTRAIKVLYFPMSDDESEDDREDQRLMLKYGLARRGR